MKKRIITYAFSALLLSGFAISCAEDNFSAPTFDCSDATQGLQATITGTEVYNQASSTLQQFPVEGPELYLEAYITSSDRGGNFFKVVSMETADGKGLSVSVDMYNTYNKGFRVGRKVFIKLNGLYYIIAHNSLSLGELYINPNTGVQNTGRIAERNVPNHVFFSCDFKTEEELIHEVTLLQAKSNNNINKLLRIKNVEFEENGVPYYDPAVVIGGSTNRNIVDAVNNKLIFRTGSYADYAGNIIPKKSGTIVGVMTKYNSDFQFVSRDRHDIQLTEVPLSDQQPEPEIPQAPVNLFFGGSDFENWTTFTASMNSYGLKSYAAQSSGTGVLNTNSLHLNGTPTGNDYVFTILASAHGTIPANPTKITFWVKGTSGKSLSLNVYRASGSGYEVFNVGDLATTPKILAKAEINSSTGNGTNSYTGVIDTNNQWVKITLDLTEVSINTNSGDLFALKVGKDVVYNLHIDNIEIQ